MFDVAPSEMLIVAIVALLVIGPKDLPKALRFIGNWIGKARGMARHFRSGLDTMMREAELDEMEKKWRDHNDAIMRAYPTIDGVMLPSPAPIAATAGPAVDALPAERTDQPTDSDGQPAPAAAPPTSPA